jgi:hypothetical protein
MHGAPPLGCWGGGSSPGRVGALGTQRFHSTKDRSYLPAMSCELCTAIIARHDWHMFDLQGCYKTQSSRFTDRLADSKLGCNFRLPVLAVNTRRLEREKWKMVC